MRRVLSAPGGAWCVLALLLALGALLPLVAPALPLDWQPAQFSHQAWRLWTAAFVHFSLLHLGSNLLGVALVATLGWRAAVPWHLTLAWCAAWPLTHLGLLLQPELAQYGGLSGVLHAGVAVVAVWLVAHHRGRRRTLGQAMLAVLALKLLSETPWAAAVQWREGWDIGIAPFAHVTGSLAGLGCATLAVGWRR